MARSDFVRARRFLNYNPVAKWSALVAGVGTGVLYLCFLFLLGLFTDVLVNQGTIPTLHHLPPYQQQRFLGHLARMETPPWKDRHQAEPAPWLAEIGFHTEDIAPADYESLLALAAAEDPEALPKRQQVLYQELLWRDHIHTTLRDSVGADAAALTAQRVRELTKEIGPQLALDRDIPDCGILSLVVRVQHRIDGWIAAWVAYFNPWMWNAGVWTYLVGLLIIAVVFALLRSALFFVNEYAAALATTEAVTRLRRAIYHHTYRLGSLAFRTLGPTEAVGVSARHLESVHDGLLAWLTVHFREPIKFCLLFLFALVLSPWLALAFLMFALLVWMTGGQIAAAFRRQGRRASEKAAEEMALLQESLMMMRLVKVYQMELFNQNRVERQLTRYGSTQLRRLRGEAIYRPVLTFLALLAALVLLFIVGVVVAQGQLSMAGAIVLITALVSMYLPFQAWLDQRRFLRRARDSARVLFEFLDRSGGVGQAVEAEFLPPLSDNLEFDNVTLKEPGTGRTLLRDVSLTIRAGERVALVGPEDNDKYALIYLISRFLDPTTGEIRIDRKNLRWITLESLRAQIAIVLQHNLVFNDTVANNIGCGDRHYTLPQIIEVAKIAHAHQFIQKLPKGYETPIGELGHPLSISQQFRIALARAILRDPALLIIEEPQVPLEDQVKDLLDDTMARVLPGRTVIFIPHRLSTIKRCNQVYLLHEGRIADAGDHKDLQSRNELYRHLQYLEFNEFAGVVRNI